MPAAAKAAGASLAAEVLSLVAQGTACLVAEDIPAAEASVGHTAFVVVASANRPLSPLRPRTRLARARHFGTWSGASEALLSAVAVLVGTDSPVAAAPGP